MERQPVILAVDDTPQNIKVLEAVLTPRGYRVIPAGSGAEALAQVKHIQPDLILLDVVMPGMDGYAVCRRLREDPATRMLPVVMITASGHQEKVNAIEAGADDLLPKPFNQAELLARVRSLLRIKTYHDTIQAQAAELAEWNRTLEIRVQEQVEQLRAAEAQIIEKEKLERELEVAREIQERMLPRALPRLAGFDFGARMVPARLIGGDFFDLFPLGPTAVGLVVADVCGKGVPAALHMALTRSLLRAEASHTVSVRQTLQQVNRQLLDMSDAGLFVTVLYGVLDQATRAFAYARAGHDVPLVVDADGEVIRPPRGQGQPLGIFDEPAIDEQSIAIPEGGTLLLYTDGVTEALDERHTLFGVKRLEATVHKHRHISAQALCDQLFDCVTAYRGAMPQADDVTLVAARAC